MPDEVEVPSVLPNGNLIEYIGRISAPTLLAIIIVTNFAGLWVSGSSYNKLEAEKDRWLAMALEGLKTSKEISTARIPIMSAPPVNEITPEDVKKQLEVIKDVNGVSE